MDNGASVADEVRKAFAGGFEDEDEIEAETEQMTVQVGLASLG